MSNDPESTLYRVCASSADNIALVRQTAVRLAGGRPPADVRNIRSRFCFGNPLVLDFIIGANEALIAIPDRRSRPSLRACVVVDDPDFVTAMQDWYDEFIWEPACDWVELSYDTLDTALDEVEARLREDERSLHHQVDELGRAGDDLLRRPAGERGLHLGRRQGHAAPCPRPRCRRRPPSCPAPCR